MTAVFGWKQLFRIGLVEKIVLELRGVGHCLAFVSAGENPFG
ncbi:hypothetical protein [Flavimaricola marinus]|uniref:Uncharacterized protein n=1 Tax=Flavimaricola marinus TaxID=1819565 RepID=A0A238LIM0_9RHOB|nr:hypothetical protein [Flavimaricola marinus]SMY09393.1 hypothetical protein LOM8899_03560 [Flavimaricola marinus]